MRGYVERVMPKSYSVRRVEELEESRLREVSMRLSRRNRGGWGREALCPFSCQTPRAVRPSYGETCKLVTLTWWGKYCAKTHSPGSAAWQWCISAADPRKNKGSSGGRSDRFTGKTRQRCQKGLIV